jgi:hypothetical protein
MNVSARTIDKPVMAAKPIHALLGPVENASAISRTMPRVTVMASR